MSVGFTRISGTNAFAVTPNDGVNLAHTTRGLYIGVSGDVKVTTTGGDILVFVGMAAGVIHPIGVSRVWNTSTTATSIVGVY